MNKMVDWNKMMNDIQVVVDNAGYFYISDRPLSTHPDDWYLRCVVAFKMIDDRTEYVTWIYNATLGENGSLNSGHYFWSSDHDYLERT